MQLRGLHVVYTDRLINHPLRERTPNNGTYGRVDNLSFDG